MNSYNFEFERLTGGKELICTMADSFQSALLKGLALAKITHDVAATDMKSVSLTLCGE